MEGRSAPRSVNYDNSLPLAIEGRAHRRQFFTQNGATYGSTTNNIVIMDINADSMLDTQSSYFSLTLNNTSGSNLSLDMGQPFIRRLRISSAGVILEDIQSYNRLVGGVLFPAAVSKSSIISDKSLTGEGYFSSPFDTLSAATGGGGNDDAAVAFIAPDEAAYQVIGDTSTIDEGTNITTRITEALADTNLAIQADYRCAAKTALVGKAIDGCSNTTAMTIATGQSFTYNFNIVSALFNSEVYLPLVLMNAGLRVEIELAPPAEVGIWGGAVGTGYNISDVRYNAHLIDLERSFYERLRMVQQSSGGVLQLSGATYRHYADRVAAGAGNATINVPARVKSIKSIFFLLGNEAASTSSTQYSLSPSQHFNLSEFQFRVGSVNYPPSAVRGTLDGVEGVMGNSNRGEFYSELMKAFGSLGGAKTDSLLSAYNYAQNDGSSGQTESLNASLSSGVPSLVAPCYTPFGMDFETFPREALESGVDTASRSLQTTLALTMAANTPANAVVDTFVLADALFFVNMDGSVSVSV